MRVRRSTWFASACGYLWLLTDVLPTAEGSPVDLQVTPTGVPTPRSALLRIVSSIPAILLVVVLSAAASVAWLVGSVTIFVDQRMPGTMPTF